MSSYLSSKEVLFLTSLSRLKIKTLERWLSPHSTTKSKLMWFKWRCRSKESLEALTKAYRRFYRCFRTCRPKWEMRWRLPNKGNKHRATWRLMLVRMVLDFPKLSQSTLVETGMRFPPSKATSLKVLATPIAQDNNFLNKIIPNSHKKMRKSSWKNME